METKMMDAGRPATPDGYTCLGAINISLPTDALSFSSPSALPLKGVYSPQPTARYSNYTPKSVPALSPQPSPDNNRENVMNALKKLQEKIRRLEMERSVAEGNLRVLTSETTRYRDLLNRERSFKPYEPVQSEVSKNTQELQSQLSCAENRCGLLEKQLEYMRKLVQDSETDKIRLIEKHREHESKLLRDDVASKVKAEKLSEIERDHQRLSEHQDRAEKKIRELENKLASEIKNRKSAEEKLKDSMSIKPEEKRKLKSKTVLKAKSARAPSEATQRLHYHLNLNEMPFLHGKSTSPSHHVSANVQKVLALMKSHNNVMCEKPGQKSLAEPTSSSSSSESDLNELIVQLQEEYVQMKSEHDELNAQLAAEENQALKYDLEQELGHLTRKLEIKLEQISQLKHHLHTMEKRRIKRKVKSDKKIVRKPTATTLATAQRAKRVEKPIRSCSSDRDSRLKILRDMKKLQSSLRPDDLSWDC